MTSLAFVGGVFPLVVATGAGAEIRQSLGTAVFGGMIGVSLFGIFLTPVFFYVIRGGLARVRTPTGETAPHAADGSSGALGAATPPSRRR